MKHSFSRYKSRLQQATALFVIASTQLFAAAPVHLDRAGDRWANTTLHSMSLEEKIGQLIMPWARIQFMNVNDPAYLLLREEMKKYHVGGFGVTVFADGAALSKSEPLEAAALTNSLQRDSKYPLIFAADFERGLAMRLNGATGFPAAMAFGAAGSDELAQRFGSITAHEARAIGVQWNWFPVADVNSNPANPIINTRSFGEDPAKAGELVAAYIKGARAEGMLTTAKHFPGHGDTDVDSHLTLARVTASKERLNEVELVPFRDAIAAGVDSIMTAHITVPSIEPDPNKPASISSNVITDLLQKQLKFKGLVVTDALDMGALTRVFPGTLAQVSAAEAVAAIQAGNDMVIIPADLDGAYNGLLNAVKNGTISREQIDTRVLKVLRMKASVGLNRNRFVDPEAVTREIALPDNLAFAQTVADRGITLATDTGHLLPLPATPAAPVVAVIFTDDARSSDGGHAFARQLRKHVPNATVLYVDQNNAQFASAEVLSAAAGAGTVIAVAEAVPSARRTTGATAKGSADLSQDGAQILADLLKVAPAKTVVAALGNPYVGTQIQGIQTHGIQTYICTFSNTPESANSLVRAIFGEIPINGHLPVTLPGIAQRGTGLNR